MTRRAELLEEALALSDADRRWLTDMLLEHVPREPEADVEAAWRAELVRRLEQLERGEAEVISGAEIKRRLDAIIGD